MHSNSEPQGCLAFLLSFVGIRLRSPAKPRPYRQRDDFLSPAELAFYRVLVPVVDSRYVICPKVRIADLVYTVERNDRANMNRIIQKHVDFVLCEKESMKPILVIELDDSSHARADRQERDELVDAVFESAQLPLLHVRAATRYVPQELRSQIEQALSSNLGTSERPQTQPAVAKRSGPPNCPKCGVPMVSRTSQRGDRAGQRFWGCANYPQCREIVDILPDS
jgi:very-short-patch-repair endonuclease